MRSLLALAACALCACADAQSPEPSAAGPTVIADGRDADAGPPPGASRPGPAVEAAVREARAHWQRADAGYEEDMGAFADRSGVMAVADGAFTRTGAGERAVLYLMSLWPRCCPKMGLAVTEGDRLVRNVAFEGVAQSVRAVPDLDGDGLDELVLVGSFGMGGQVSQSATLVSFGPDGLANRGEVALYDGACGAGHDGETAARLLDEPGAGLTVERFGRSTCEGGTWEAEGAAEPFPATDPSPGAYVTLSGD